MSSLSVRLKKQYNRIRNSPLAPHQLKDYWTSRKPYYRRIERKWQSKQPDPQAELAYTVLLVGDMGYPALNGKDPVLNMLAGHIATKNEKMAVVFLGDNIYPRGLPEPGHRLRRISEERIKAQLDLFTDFKGKVYYLSGNHDWNKGKKNGFEYLQRQEEYIEQYLNRGNIYLPDNGCPGPVLLDLTDDVLLIVINTQWWVQRGIKPIGPFYKCEAQSEEHFFQLLDEAMAKNSHRKILVAAHHPLYSNALHGGKFSMKHHIFPLTSAHKKLYIPLPVAGSLYPLYRRLFGAYEDMSHPRYRRMRKGLLKVFKKYQNIVYAAGHDHNLQYFNLHHNHYIVSGSGSKVSFVHKGGKASFTHAHRGIFQINYYTNGETWMKVVEPADELDKHPVVMFQKQLEHVQVNAVGV
jgi:hypothetical protein